MIRYLNFPKLPDSLLEQINFNFDEYEKKVQGNNHVWTDSFNSEVNAWCQKNICSDMYFAFQIINGNLRIHKDTGTKTKLNYLLELGGDNVITNFYEDDKVTITHSYVIESHRWHILKADSYHGVTNVEPGKYRVSISGRVFPD